jgi:hypothetical protein
MSIRASWESIENPSLEVERLKSEAELRYLQRSLAGTINAATCSRDARGRFVRRFPAEIEGNPWWLAL